MATVNSVDDANRIVLDVVEKQYAAYRKVMDDLNRKDLRIIAEAEYCLSEVGRWEMLFWGFNVVSFALDTDATELSERLSEIRSEITAKKTEYVKNLDNTKRERSQLDAAAAAQHLASQRAGTPPAAAAPQDHAAQIAQISTDYFEWQRQLLNYNLRVGSLTSMGMRLDLAQLKASIDTGFWPFARR